VGLRATSRGGRARGGIENRRRSAERGRRSRPTQPGRSGPPYIEHALRVLIRTSRVIV
jgi:hypothetical protein